MALDQKNDIRSSIDASSHVGREDFIFLSLTRIVLEACQFRQSLACRSFAGRKEIMFNFHRNTVEPFFCPIRSIPIMFQFDLKVTYPVFSRPKLKRQLVGYR
jgi:hypothetical protein